MPPLCNSFKRILFAAGSSLPPLSHLVKFYDGGFNRRHMGGKHKGKESKGG